MSEMCPSPPGAAGASDPSLLSVSLGAAVFSPVLPCVHRPLCALESHQLSAHPLEGGAGEVVEHRVQYAVEEGEGQCGLEDHVYYLHGFTRPLGPNPHPDQHLGHVAGQEADNEHHHHLLMLSWRSRCLRLSSETMRSEQTRIRVRGTKKEIMKTDLYQRDAGSKARS